MSKKNQKLLLKFSSLFFFCTYSFALFAFEGLIIDTISGITVLGLLIFSTNLKLKK